jgi:transcription antitermination factor NusG
MPKKEKYWVWLIAYIDSATVKLVHKELKRYLEYKEVEVFIPTVKVLKKTFKGDDKFDEVPLLFQYGFFKVPRKYAVSSAYLENMQNNISCIYGWLRDPHKNILRDATRKMKKIKDKDIPIATATPDQIADLVKKAFDFSIHTPDEIDSVKKGDFVTLRGYPFDNVQAEIVELNAKKKKAKVKIHIFDGTKEVDVSFDNIFFTVYHEGGYDDRLSNNESLDELMEHRRKKLFKKLPDEGIE